MWPMGFISLSSSMRKAEEARKIEKKPTKISRKIIKLSPATKNVDRKTKVDKQNIVKKRLDFYESKESDDSKNKLDLNSFAQFAVSMPDKKRICDPQKYISRSLSLQSDDEEGHILPQKNIPVFRSSSQFERYFSEGEGEDSIFSCRGESDADGLVTDFSHGSPQPPSQIFSDQESSYTNKPTNVRIKKVQFISSSPKKVSPDESVEKNVAGKPKLIKQASTNQEDDSEEDMSQKEWYKQVFRVVHKLDNLYTNYPIPQVDVNENMIPPRPRLKKEDGRNSIGCRDVCNVSVRRGVPDSSFRDLRYTRSNSLPSTCRAECLPVQTSFKNSKKVVLTGDNSSRDIKKTGNNITAHCDWIVSRSQKFQLQEPFANKSRIIETDWQDFWRPTKAGVKLFEDKDKMKRAVALFDFYAHYDNELSFRRGEEVSLIRRVDENWFEGDREGRRGLVPSNYLEVLKSPSNGVRGGLKIPGSSGLVVKDFQANYPSEISAKKNDVVSIMRHLRGDWLEVRIGTRSGLIPANHVGSHVNHD